VFPAKKGKNNSIRCWEYYGPSFGKRDLASEFQPYNRKDKCNSWSWKNDRTYNIGVDSQERNMLTNQPSLLLDSGNKACEFTISELEVWKVKMVGGEKKQK
jgi:hypothetical protein